MLSHQIHLNETGNRKNHSAEAKQRTAENDEKWVSPAPLSPIMTRFPWDLKDASGATDDKKSNLDSPEGEWSTSRRELWCFYLYYVVRFLYLFLAWFLSQSTKGQQRAVRIQLWAVPVPESPLPRWL